jgi:hypothetical protein
VPPKPAPASDKWIEIRLVEDGTGNPIPGVGLSLKLPGAPQPSAFTTDDDGSASAGKLPAGTAAIEGLEDDDGIWELVSISAG